MRARSLFVGCLLVASKAAADQIVTIGLGATLSFTPSTVTVAPGEKVTWNWDPGFIISHSTTSDSQTGPEVWDSEILPQGSTFSHTFNTPGSYPYYCKMHSLPASDGGTVMNGIVNVVALTSTPTTTRTPTATPTQTPTPTVTPTPTITPTLTPPIGRSFFALTPCRVVDTRAAAGPLGGPALAAGDTRSFVLAGKCGISLTAVAVSLNVTVTSPTAAGDLRVFPGGGAPPLVVSTINYRQGQTRANNALAGLGALGDVSVKCDQGSGTVQLIVDVNGYSE